MKQIEFTKRVWGSPLIEYANFGEGKHINLIRLVKPYANGLSYAIHETVDTPFCKNGMFRNYDKAKRQFELMVLIASHKYEVTSRGLTGN